MRKDARIFVAGHTGLIGSALLRRLEEEGCRNVLTVPRSQLDLQNGQGVEKFFGETRPEYVLLAAGRVGGIIENQKYPAEFMAENISIQLNILNAAKKTGVLKLILFGSSCMYPRECPQPMAEDAILSGKLEETSLPYAISKLAGVYLCMAFNKQYHGHRFIPVIPNTAYGPNDNFETDSAHVLPALIAKFHDAKMRETDSICLWGSGLPRREFVHADDIADACMYLLVQDTSRWLFPMNIGVGSDVSIRELAESVARVVGYKGSIVWDRSKPDGAPSKFLNNNRLSTAGWQAKIPLEEGLWSTYKWFVENKCESA